VDVNYKPWFAATSINYLTVSDIEYEVLSTKVPQSWCAATQISPKCRAKQPLNQKVRLGCKEIHSLLRFIRESEVPGLSRYGIAGCECAVQCIIVTEEHHRNQAGWPPSR